MPVTSDPFLWLEKIEGTEALNWVEQQNGRTQARFESDALEADQIALTSIEDLPTNIPTVTRLGGKLYNFWTDVTHTRGLWRRTTLESYKTSAPVWETLLDLDDLANAEKEDWVYKGACVNPKTHDRAMLRLSRGGADSIVLREYDLATCSFVMDGFRVPEARSRAVWYDRDTLLLSSALGKGDQTSAGYPRTVRFWRRNTDLLSAKIIFDVPPDHNGVQVIVDEEGATKRLVFVDHIKSFDMTIMLGDPSGAKTRLDLPSDLSAISWARGWLAVKTTTPWTIEGVTHGPGEVLGIGLDDFLEGSRTFDVLFTPGPRRICCGEFWAGGHYVVSVLDNLVPSHIIFAPSKGKWTGKLLGHMPTDGMFSVEVKALDENSDESDGSLLVMKQDPLNPQQLLLTSVTSIYPTILKSRPAVFDAQGLTVSRHETSSTDGKSIPYVQIGPLIKSYDAPIYMTGYGGFGVFADPFRYRGGLGKVWLERGGTVVIAIIRGDGEFGPQWEEEGRREGKSLCHDDFAAIAADLVTRKVTKPGRIAAHGSSNGGLLILNMLNRYPNYFGALSCSIPLADMERYTKLLVGSTWTSEYGDPEKPEDWDFLQRLSPYHNVAAEGPSPPVLIMTTRRDDRVHPAHARKMAAMLQSVDREAWFFELETGGHSLGKSSFERARSEALVFAFLRMAIDWNLPSVFR